jgi:hypothetical protein
MGKVLVYRPVANWSMYLDCYPMVISDIEEFLLRSYK